MFQHERAPNAVHRRGNHSGRDLAAVLPLLLVLAAGLAVEARVGQQGGGPDTGSVARAFFDALASGKPERFEAMAQERFAPALLARRTPAERAQMVARIRGDFGTMTLGGIRNVNDEQVIVTVRGSTGMAGRIQLSVEPAAPHRITLVSIEVGDQDDGPPGPPPPPINGAMTPVDLERALDAYLAARASADEFAGVLAIAKDGRVVFQKAYGLADREAKTPVTVETRFNIASIGKALTKTAVGQLVSQGRLALTDTIGKWLPDYPNPKARAATVDQLLNHQAGIADFFGPAFDAAPKSQFASNADYYRFVSAQPLLFDPGTNRQYCNGCYVVLGEIIAKVSGQSYEDYVGEHVFKPARMSGAGFFRSDRLPRAAAQQYSRQIPGSQGALQNARDAHGVTGSAAGGAYATAADLLAFDDAIRTGKLLDPKMTAWFLEAEPPSTAAAAARARGGIGFAGGAPGTNALLETDETWAVAVVGNLDPPASVGVGQAIKRALGK
jgi:D-alanyl-D-alanine carboxypeptidase